MGIRFENVKPNYVIHTAAFVGGIGRNLANPAQQYYQNILKISQNIAIFFNESEIKIFQSLYDELPIEIDNKRQKIVKRQIFL